MKNMKVSRKLITAFGIVLALMIIIVVFSVNALNVIKGKMDTFYAESFADVQLADELRLKVNEAAKDMLHASTAPSLEEVNERLVMAINDIAAMEETLAVLSENYSGDMADIDSITSCIEALKPVLQEFAEVAQYDSTGAFAIYKKKALPQLQTMLTHCNNIKDYEAVSAEEIYTYTATQSQLTIIVISIISLGAVIAGIGLAVYITKLLVNGIREVEAAADKMAEGNFEIEIAYDGRDEIGGLAKSMKSLGDRTKEVIADLDETLAKIAEGNLNIRIDNAQLYIGVFSSIAESLNSFVEQLNDTLYSINRSSDQVASGSSQVSGGAQALSQGATEQASSIQQLSASINMISGMVTANARDAVAASGKTNEAGMLMAEANSKMEELVAAMEEISTSSEEIQKIISAIEDIAFETNILALNAAVEAARAGDAGKGFAVVADEVRNLAGKSAEAANSTTALIQSTVEAINRGNMLVSEVADRMNDVQNSAGQVAELNGKISDASRTAAEAITQVTTGVDQISAVVQNNSATAEQSAAASEELSGQSQMLKDLISRFVFRNE
ncbi:MAG: HAMP domain-containing protein [Oscillospiraceae bacterium]|nr:HAMP domain-containing protein [Oscillospiraceae bacterium]